MTAIIEKKHNKTVHSLRTKKRQHIPFQDAGKYPCKSVSGKKSLLLVFALVISLFSRSPQIITDNFFIRNLSKKF